MPIWEADCVNAECGYKAEYYSPGGRQEERSCPRCGSPMKRKDVHAFAVVRTGPVGGKYAGKHKESYYESGHIAWRVRSSRSGKPEPIWIDTWEKQKQFCKEEGLYNPWEVPSCPEV